MNIKEEIESILESLKRLGIKRGDIEKALNYSENYIDQTLSKGGNEKFLGALKRYAEEFLPSGSKSMANEELVLYAKDYDKLIEQILSDRQVIIDLHQERSKQAEELAKKMEGHYEDAKKLNLRLLDIIDNSLKDITKNLKDTAAKLKSK